MKMKIKKGFSLLELTLVLGVGTIVAFMKFQDMKNEQESIMASAVGQQMKQIGEAVNGYINIRYDKLSTLSNAAGTGTDPGPRTCSGSVCEITYQTLINEGLLPSTYTGTNANKSSYKIILKRDGTTPNYVINGLITTSTAWIEGGKTRYDLLGKAMQTAGIDSGMTRTTSIASGHSGQWTETSANFNNITSTGQLAFRVGFNSALYSVYLRRDGTLPMTGDLNLDGHNINNVAALNATGDLTTTGNISGKDINATGAIKAGGDITSGGWLRATTGFGDQIVIGGDDHGRDYEIKLKTKGLPLVIHDDYNSTDYTILRTYGSFQALGDIKASKTDTLSGNITAGGQVIAHNGYGDTITLGGDAAGNDFDIRIGPGGKNYLGVLSWDKTPITLAANGVVLARDPVSSNNYVSLDGTTGNITASGNIEAAKNVKGATLESTGRTTVGEFVQLNGQATVGATCSPNGLQGTDSTGLLLSCVGGKWTKASGGGGGLYSTNTKDGNSATCSTPNIDTNACSCPSGKTSVVIMSSISTSTTIRPDNGQGVTTKNTQRLYQCR